MHTTVLLLAMVAALGQAPSAQTPARFDNLIREDFFAGVAGDEVRLQKAMDLCERRLAENPNHPEALVWHGAGVLVRSGRAFRAGDFARGGDLFMTGLDEMNRAVELAPDNIGVLIPRGATLFEATRTMPGDQARPLIESAIANYEHVLALQAPYFAKLGDHEKGELLFGLAEGYDRLGEHQKARVYFQRLVAEAPQSGQADKARTWMATGTVAKSTGQTSCTGCHVAR